MLQYLRKNIIAGLFVIIPLAITIWIVLFIFEKLTSWSLFVFVHIPYIGHYAQEFPFDNIVRIASLAFIILVVFFVGALTRNTIGSRVIRMAEWFLLKAPMVRIIYSTIKNISDAIRSHKSGMFSKVVLFEYPRRGIYSIGFVTNEENELWEIGEKLSDENLISVFVPTTPNPTSGYLLFLPYEQLTYLDMSVAAAMRLIISGGAVTPKMKNLTVRK